MEWLELGIRTVVMYFFIFIIIRLMGKREIGKLSVFDLVVSVMIAEIAIIEIESPDENLMHGVLPILILLFIQLITAFMSMKSRKIRLLLDGKPTVFVAKGKIYKDELKKQRYNLDDLMQQLRENGVTSISEVDFAILETSGKLSVIHKSNSDTDDSGADNKEKQIKPKEDSKKRIIPPGFRYEFLPIPLIMDGKVIDENLDKINQTRFWLKNIIQREGAKHFREVLLCTIDHKEKIFIDMNNKNKN